MSSEDDDGARRLAAGQARLAGGGDQHDRISSNSSATSELTTSTADTQDEHKQILTHKKTNQAGRSSGLGERGQTRTQIQHHNNHLLGPPGQKFRMKGGTSRRAKEATITTTTLNGGGGSGNKNGNGKPELDGTAGSRQDPASDRSTRLLVALFLIGLIVCVTSITCILLLPSLVSNQIAKKLVLKNNSMLLERWSKPNVPMYFKVWLYDIKNAQEIIDKRDTKPQVEEIGPFVFNLKRQKDVISFAGDNLYYTERKIYHFNRKLSCCAINTTVTIPNIPLVAVVDRALGYNLPLLGRFIPRLINRAIQSLREQLFVRKQVNEILFDGYDVELLKMVSRIGSLVGLPQQSQKFALLKGRNDTWRPEQDGVWAINTGQRDRRQFGRVASWNSYKKLPFWPADKCNVINGSDGTLFPPPIKSSEPLYIFNQELCRTVNLVFDGPSNVRSIQAFRFVLNPMNFAHTMTGQPQELAPVTSLPGAALSRLTLANQQVGQRQPSSLPQSPKPPPQSERPRLNPLFQNPRPLQPLELVPVLRDPNGGPPIATLRVPEEAPTAAAAPPPFRAQTRARQRVGDGGGHSLSGPIPSRRTTLTSQADIATSASERRTIRSEPSKAQAPVGSFPTPSEASADAGASPQVASGTRTNNRESTEATIRSHQEKLIRVAQEAQLANERKSKLNPQTCFCDRKTTNLNGVNVCEFDGLIDLSKCSKQAQVIFGSMPHFYNSDPRLMSQVVGLAPNASKHTTYLDIEPNTGLVLGGKRRVQLNVIIKHNNEIDGFENINDMLVPIVWFEESAQIPEEAAQKFRSMYVDKIRLINMILFSLLTASIALLAVDAKLLIATRRWREFKLMRLSGHLTGGSGGQANGPPPPTSVQRDKLKGAARDANGLTYHSPSKRRHFRTQESNKGESNASRRQDQSRRLDRSLRMASAPLVAHLTSPRQASNGSAESPLLQSGSSATTASGDSSPSVTPPSSPQDSPELRKWSPGGGGGRLLTRVQLNNQTAPTATGEQLPVKIDSTNENSIIELGASGAFQSGK